MFQMQKQKFLHRPNDPVKTWGDCHRTCIANLIGVDRDTIPHSHEDDWTAKITDYLKTIGLRELRVHWQGSLSEVLEHHRRLNPDLLYIVSGKTEKETVHSVLCLGASIMHDPGIEPPTNLVAPMSEDGFGAAYILLDGLEPQTPDAIEQLLVSWRITQVVQVSF